LLAFATSSAARLDIFSRSQFRRRRIKHIETLPEEHCQVEGRMLPDASVLHGTVLLPSPETKTLPLPDAKWSKRPLTPQMERPRSEPGAVYSRPPPVLRIFTIFHPGVFIIIHPPPGFAF